MGLRPFLLLPFYPALPLFNFLGLAVLADASCSVLVHSCFRNVGLHIYEWATFWLKFGLLRYLIVFQMLFLLLQNIRAQTVT